MQIILVDETISVLISHAEDLEFLNLWLVKHGKHMVCCLLGLCLFAPRAGSFILEMCPLEATVHVV